MCGRRGARAEARGAPGRAGEVRAEGGRRAGRGGGSGAERGASAGIRGRGSGGGGARGATGGAGAGAGAGRAVCGCKGDARKEVRRRGGRWGPPRGPGASGPGVEISMKPSTWAPNKGS